MTLLLKFSEVSFFKDEEFGISDVSFSIQKGKKYVFIFESEEKLNALLGIIEGRYQNDSGTIHRSNRLFWQSDRLLLGDKIYSKTAEKWLALNHEFFHFDGGKRSKRMFMESISARHIRHFPIYKLKGEDRIKFALLALAFQETGILLISRLPTLDLPMKLKPFFTRLVRGTHCTVCLFASLEKNVTHRVPLLDSPTIRKITID